MKKYIGLVLLFTFMQLSAAVSFDGVDDVIECGAQNQLDDLSALTVIVWANFVDSGENTYGTYLAKSTAGVDGWYVDLNADMPRFVYVDSPCCLVRRSVAATTDYGKWTRYLTTWDGSTTAANVHILLDGTETTYNQTSNGTTLPSDAAANLYIGNRSNTANTSNGDIACVAIWEGVLDSSSIATLTTSPCRTALKIRGDIIRFYAELDGGRDGAASSSIINLVDGSTCTATNSPTARAASIAR